MSGNCNVKSQDVNVVLVADIEDGTEVDFRECRGAMAYIPDDSMLSALTVYCSPNGITWYLYGLPIAVAAGTCVDLPAGIFAAAHVKLIGDVVDTIRLDSKH